MQVVDVTWFGFDDLVLLSRAGKVGEESLPCLRVLWTNSVLILSYIEATNLKPMSVFHRLFTF